MAKAHHSKLLYEFDVRVGFGPQVPIDFVPDMGCKPRAYFLSSQCVSSEVMIGVKLKGKGRNLMLFRL